MLIERPLAKIVQATLKPYAQRLQGWRGNVVGAKEIAVFGFLEERVMKRAVRLPICVPILNRHRAPHEDDGFFKPDPQARPIALVRYAHGLILEQRAK